MSDKQDKQFDPTAQRLAKAREDGNVFKSQEITSVFSLTLGISVIALGLPAVFNSMRSLAARIFADAATTAVTPDTLPGLMLDYGGAALMLMLPFMGMLMVAGIGINVAQTGINITTKPLVPKFSRISPKKGFGRIFSSKGLYTTGKSLLKIFIVGPIAYSNISGHLPEISMLHTLPVFGILDVAGGWIMSLVFQLILVLFALSVIDFFYEKWRYNEDLKMSKQEIKDEQKQNEGDLQMKGKRRQMAVAMLRKPRLDHAVMQADVVVTNPTHYAVALRYDPELGGAPRVLVKGIRKRALRIKALAKELGIPTVENRPLARALHASVEEQAEIPPELYPAVATLLAEIYRQSGRRPAA